MSQVDGRDKGLSSPRAFSRLRWASVSLVAIVVGSWLWNTPPERPASHLRNVTIPSGRLADESPSTSKDEDAVAGDEQWPPAREVSKQEQQIHSTSCPVPGLSGGGASRDVEYHGALDFRAKGGTFKFARYRIIGAYAEEQSFVPGRWSMVLDLAPAGEGAFYRQLGFQPQASRIEWKVDDKVLSYRTICPDPGETVLLPFSVDGDQLKLMAPSGVLLVLESYADSQVAKLPALLVSP